VGNTRSSPHRRLLDAAVDRPQPRRVGPTARTGIGQLSRVRQLGRGARFRCRTAAGAAAGHVLTAIRHACPGMGGRCVSNTCTGPRRTGEGPTGLRPNA
jgi:hypothetical protein